MSELSFIFGNITEIFSGIALAIIIFIGNYIRRIHEKIETVHIAVMGVEEVENIEGILEIVDRHESNWKYLKHKLNMNELEINGSPKFRIKREANEYHD